jgi:hypothetical protein
MNENRMQVLEMLAAGQITAQEAERLIAALEGGSSAGAAAPGTESAQKTRPKYLRVLVEAEELGNAHGPTKVNVRVPMQLLRAGVKLANLIPAQARDHVNVALHEKGIPFDLSQIKPENLEEIIDQIGDLTVDVDDKNARVKVFCE